MKALGLLAVVLTMVLAFTAGTAFAGSKVIVKKGDTLWEIARSEWGTGKLWPIIAEKNGINDPKKLGIGKELIIPNVANISIENHLTAPYGAKAVKGDKKVLGFIKNTKIAKNIKSALENAVNALDPEPYVLKKGETVKYVSDAQGVYGNNITRFTFNWEKVDNLKAWRWSVVFNDVAYELIVIESCGNANLRWHKIAAKQPKKVVYTEVPEKIEPAKIIQKNKVIYTEEEECDPEMEAIVGGYVWVHDPSNADARTFGKGGYGEGMYWKNCQGNCSGEYWWGAGILANAYDYAADDFPSEGDGWRVAGEIGLKRLYEDNALNRSWQVKLRLGYQESNWKNPDTGDGIRQYGPVYGAYHEYIREVKRNRLWFLSQTEFWAGFDQYIGAPDGWNVDPEPRNYFQTLLGFDYRLAPRLTARAQAGYGYQGWDSESLIPANLQLIYHLPNKNGKIAIGPYAHFYPSSLGNTYGALIRYESGDLWRKMYGDHRESDVVYTGRGIANKKNNGTVMR